MSIEAPSAAGFAKVNPTGGTNQAEAAATLHYGANQTVNDVVVAQLDAEGYVTIFTQQAADVIIDVSGWYRPLTGTWTYRYDGDGLRVAKVAPQGQTTNYTWDHTSGLPLLLAETTGGQTTRWTYGPGGRPISQHNPDGSVVFFHQDQIGSTRLLTSTTGTVPATYAYDPYGRQTSKTGTASTPLGYTGQYTDAETGFQYLRARYYDPATGQFLTRDPLEALTREAYGYVGGNPLNMTDPSGLCWPDSLCEAAGDAVSAAGRLGHDLVLNASFGPLPSVNSVGQVAAVITGGDCYRRADRWECDGASWLPDDAMTIGDVVLHGGQNPMDRNLFEHEANHSDQWAAFGGWGFIGAYVFDWAAHRGNVDCMWLEQNADGAKGGHPCDSTSILGCIK